MKRSIIKSIKVVCTLLGVLAITGYVGVDYYFSQLEMKKRSDSIVMALPAGYTERSLPPYEGPHPALLDRPEDPFQYPIEIGQAGPVEPIFAGPKQYPFACRRKYADRD